MERKIERAAQAASGYKVNGVKFITKKLIAMCDDQYQEDMKQLMCVLDFESDNIVAGAVEIPIQEWPSDEMFEEAQTADEKEMECMHRLRLRDAKPGELEQ